MSNDDDIEEYLDPVPDDGSGWLPELYSLGGFIVGMHFLVAGAVLPLVWIAVENGAYVQAGIYGALSGLLIAAGFVVGRLANQRV